MSTEGVRCLLQLHGFHSRLRSALDEDLSASFGIDFEDYVLLRLLAEAGAMSLVSLSADLGATRAAALKRLRPLEKIGLVACEGTLSQRRVSISPAGRRVVGSAEGAVEAVWANSVAHLPAANVEALTAALDLAQGSAAIR